MSAKGGLVRRRPLSPSKRAELARKARKQFQSKGVVSAKLAPHLLKFLHTPQGERWAKTHLLAEHQLKELRSELEKLRREISER